MFMASPKRGGTNMSEILVRSAVIPDAREMASVHVECWRETYRGLVHNQMLDDPHFVDRMEDFWISTIQRLGVETRAVAVAELNGKIIGIASSISPRDPHSPWVIEIDTLYVLSGSHGSGAGSLLLDAIIGDLDAALWVIDPNPRAQAFYRKNGFAPDGEVRNARIRAIRLVRRRESSHD